MRLKHHGDNFLFNTNSVDKCTGFFGADYAAAAPVLILFLIASGVLALSVCCESVMFSFGKAKSVFICRSIATAVMVGGIVPLTAEMAAVGLAVAMVLYGLLTTALIYGTWFHFERSFDFAAPLWSRDSSIDIALPLWPAKLLVPISLALLWCRLVLQIWGFARAFRRNERHPVAVPLIEDAFTQANKEAKTVDG